MINLNQVINTGSELVLQSAFTAGVGYLAARIFTSINPVNAAVFCGVAAVVRYAVSPLFEKLFSGIGSNTSSRILGDILCGVSVVVLSSLFSSAAGFPIGCATGISLLAITVGTFAVIRLGDFAMEVATEAFYG